MSNTVVGNVYDQIIKEVVEASRVDFEESGIEESVLEELRAVSCLHSLVVAVALLVCDNVQPICDSHVCHSSLLAVVFGNLMFNPNMSGGARLSCRG
jgi:hypothetical protein